MPGHLFITRGDLLDLACDAILVPSGTWPAGDDTRYGHVMPHWRSLGITDADGFVTGDPPSRDRPVVQIRQAGWPEPSIWVGHTGDVDRAPRENAAIITAFLDAVVDATRENASESVGRPLGDPRPLVAVPLVGTGAGEHSGQKGEVVRAVVERTLTELATKHIDVVLVLKDEGDYAAAQQARFRQLGSAGWIDLDSSFDEELTALAAHANAGNLVLFLGAGVSMGAGLPSWSQLLDRLLAKVSPPVDLDAETRKTLDSRDLGTLIEKGVPHFRAALKEAITASDHGKPLERVSLMHQLLASLSRWTR